MPALLYAVAGWLASAIAAWIVARLAALVTIYYVSSSILDYAMNFLNTQLGSYAGVQVLQLAGVGDAIATIGSACAVVLAVRSATFVPGSGILGSS